MKKTVMWIAALLLLPVLGAVMFWLGSDLLEEAGSRERIEPGVVADYVHAVIQANRTVYATEIVEKLQNKGVVEAAEHWRQENALPLPAQFLIETGRLVAEEGTGVKYRLASLTPIYVWNGPQTEFERKGLEAVTRDPEKPFTGFIRIGRERFFQAVYADMAVAQACVSCHNTHMNSPKRDYKLNDVMGGIIITIPVAP
jgi:cytochrome c553